MNSMQKNELITKALQARQSAYAPYSDYLVGAALLCEDGSVYTGCNVENASYGATNCAERTAVFKAVSEGKRRFVAIAIAGGKAERATDAGQTTDVQATDADQTTDLQTTDYAFPCGVCRQVLREFADPTQMTVIVCKSVDDYKEMTLEQLLPESFGPDNLT